jgi:hypothetical protein
LESEAEYRYLSVFNRFLMAIRMTPEQIADAEKLAKEWKAK